MSNTPEIDKSKVMRAGFFGRCPQCLKGKLFSGFLKFEHDCTDCGFDYHSNDVADGPAVFVIFVASLLVVPMAMVFMLKLDAPVWLTLLIFIPAIILACLALLRPFRGLMFALQVMNDAAPGQYED